MKDYHFTPTHEWLKQEEESMCIGITDHAQSLLGDLVFVELPALGSEVEVGDEIGVLESVKAASEIYAPISGQIVEINKELSDNPALINTDPFGQGWLVKIKPHEPEQAAEQLSQLLSEEDYLQTIAEGT